jgi:hypothetical protein
MEMPNYFQNLNEIPAEGMKHFHNTPTFSKLKYPARPPKGRPIIT